MTFFIGRKWLIFSLLIILTLVLKSSGEEATKKAEEAIDGDISTLTVSSLDNCVSIYMEETAIWDLELFSNC